MLEFVLLGFVLGVIVTATLFVTQLEHILIFARRIVVDERAPVADPETR
ncbi:MAG: hypothetical protein H0X39_00315 [Actinobacteria bacterium]|nr:hypothetical protein [Actinomycetota bacterium]